MLPIVYIAQTKDTKQMLNSKDQNSHSLKIGSRLQEYRERLGLTMSAMGKIGGVTGAAQKNYETGDRSPSGEYFARLHDSGIDILYILTGRQSQLNKRLSEVEEELVIAFRCLNQNRKDNLIDIAHSLALVTAKEGT